MSWRQLKPSDLFLPGFFRASASAWASFTHSAPTLAASESQGPSCSFGQMHVLLLGPYFHVRVLLLVSKRLCELLEFSRIVKEEKTNLIEECLHSFSFMQVITRVHVLYM